MVYSKWDEGQQLQWQSMALCWKTANWSDFVGCELLPQGIQIWTEADRQVHWCGEAVSELEGNSLDLLVDPHLWPRALHGQ